MKIIGPFHQIITLVNLPLRGKLKDEELEIIHNGGIVTENGKILKIGVFEELVQEFKELNVDPSMLERLNKLAYNYLASDLVGLASLQGVGINEKFISLNDYKNLIIALAEDKVNSASAKKILTIITDTNNQDWKKEGLESLLKEYTQNNDEEALAKIVTEVLTKNAKAVTEYKSGKTTVIQFLLGQTMAATRGKASPEVLKRLLEQELAK